MPSLFDNSDDPLAGPPTSENRKTIWGVAELTSRIKSVVESSFPFVWIRGEVSNFRIPASGHLYFTLKDESAQIAAVMFRGQARQAKFVPEDGMSIVGLGRLSVYEARGSYQIILEYIEPAGIGALQIAFDKLKRRLSDQGLFEARHKKPLPFLPRKISLITSPSGAVLHDLITVISRRFPSIYLQIHSGQSSGKRCRGGDRRSDRRRKRASRFGSHHPGARRRFSRGPAGLQLGIGGDCHSQVAHSGRVGRRPRNRRDHRRFRGRPARPDPVGGRRVGGPREDRVNSALSGGARGSG